MESFVKMDSPYKELILTIAREHTWNTPDNWYNVSQKIIEKHDKNALRKFGMSAIKFVKEHIDYDYKVFLFKIKPQGYWNEIKHVKEYMLWLYDIMEYKELNDWYKVRVSDFKKYKGNGLLDKYNNTIIKILEDCYKEVVWYPWLFHTTTNGTWCDPSNHLKYLNWLECKLNIKNPEDWYRYDCKMIEKEPGGSILQNHYQHSLKRFLKIKYSNLKSYMFNVTENGYWDNKDNIKGYLNDLFQHLGYKSNDDWYKTSADELYEYYGGGLLDKGFNPWWKIITENIDYKWEIGKFKKRGYSNQACKIMETLSKILSEKLAKNIYIRHAQNHADGEFDPPNTNYSVDGYIEEYKIIIEFHGCIFHGCPLCYPNENEMNPFGGTNYDKYNATNIRKQKLIELGYNLLEIWGCSINLDNIIVNCLDIVKSADLKCSAV
jgi:hypothetical protein